MKIIKLFFFATLFVAFLMCSKNHTKVLDQETTSALQLRGTISQNDSINSDGVIVAVTPWIDVIIDSCVATEVFVDETDSVGGVGATIGDRPVVPVEPIIIP